MSDKRVLVTGAGGFIGRWSVPSLLARGYEVHAVVGRRERALSSGTRRDLELPLKGSQTHFFDLLNPTAVLEAIAALRPSHLLHFAWIATPGVYWRSADNYRWLEASRALLASFHAAGGVRAVMAGSCAEYDWTRAALCDEFLSALADESATGIPPYTECKLRLQRALEDFGAEQGVSTAWGRIFFQYGPGEHPDRLVASVIRALLAGVEAPCSHGRQIRSFLHVADVGAAFAALLDSDMRGPVNIGSGRALSLHELVELIAEQIGRPDLLRLGARATPPSEPLMLVPTVERLCALNWTPRFDLHAGIADSIAWWRA